MSTSLRRREKAVYGEDNITLKPLCKEEKAAKTTGDEQRRGEPCGHGEVGQAQLLNIESNKKPLSWMSSFSIQFLDEAAVVP